MRIAIIKDGKVANIIIAAKPVGAAQVAIPEGVFVDMGFAWNGSAFSAPAAPELVLTPRQQAAAAMQAQPVQVRAAFATAWITINTLLDFGDKAGALAFFDALPIPAELRPQADAIRALLAAI